MSGLVTTTTPATVGGSDASVDASLPRWVTTSTESGGLEREIVDAATALHSSRYRLITKLARYDTAGQWAPTGAVSCAHWAAGKLGVAVGTAREWLRVGHAVVRLVPIDKAMAEGRLSYCAVRTLTRVVADHPEHADELVELAEHSRPGELGGDLARWAHRHDSEDQRDERERRETWLSTRIDPDGMGTLTMRLPAIDLGRVRAAVDARVMQTKRVDPDDPRPSLGRQRAVAVVELVTGGAVAVGRAGGRPTPGGPTVAGGVVAVKVDTEVIVHVRSDGVSLHDGTPLADSVLAGLVDTAFIRALIHDARDRPVNASTRRRHPTPAQCRVVDEKHPRCVDCGGTELLEYDHRPPYAISRRTHTDELEPRCPRCHRRRHSTQ